MSPVSFLDTEITLIYDKNSRINNISNMQISSAILEETDLCGVLLINGQMAPQHHFS